MMSNSENHGQSVSANPEECLPAAHADSAQPGNPNAEAMRRQLEGEVGAQVRTVVDRLFWAMFSNDKGKGKE